MKVLPTFLLLTGIFVSPTTLLAADNAVNRLNDDQRDIAKGDAFLRTDRIDNAISAYKNSLRANRKVLSLIKD